jgi:(2S)-methylsuccinyl-CoA dehydrogenase
MPESSSTDSPLPDLEVAGKAVDLAESVVTGAVKRLSGVNIDSEQVLAYDVAHSAAAVRTARAALRYGSNGDIEARIACAFAADMMSELASRTTGRENEWATTTGWFSGASDFVATWRSPQAIASLAEQPGRRMLDPDFELVRETFHRFALEKIRPNAEHVHRTNSDIPEEIITGLSEIGGFGMSVPEAYGGFATGSESDYMGMVIATEELSWGSLGIGGSLITRPEILCRALVHGGTDAQKQQWLPRLASGELMAAVAVTEPDFGSDVASIVTAATPTDGGWLINGVKTWCTFAARADVLMLLARTDPDRSKSHRGLSLFVVPKPRTTGTGFAITQDSS